MSNYHQIIILLSAIAILAISIYMYVRKIQRIEREASKQQMRIMICHIDFTKDHERNRKCISEMLIAQCAKTATIDCNKHPYQRYIKRAAHEHMQLFVEVLLEKMGPSMLLMLCSDVALALHDNSDALTIWMKVQSEIHHKTTSRRKIALTTITT